MFLNFQEKGNMKSSLKLYYNEEIYSANMLEGCVIRVGGKWLAERKKFFAVSVDLYSDIINV